MDELSFINNSNDTNNSQVVIFQQNDSFSEGPEVALHLISLSPGETASVPVATDSEFHVAVINPAITVNGGVMNIGEISTPAVLMKAGQTASISGDVDLGYVISVEG